MKKQFQNILRAIGFEVKLKPFISAPTVVTNRPDGKGNVPVVESGIRIRKKLSLSPEPGKADQKPGGIIPNWEINRSPFPKL